MDASCIDPKRAVIELNVDVDPQALGSKGDVGCEPLGFTSCLIFKWSRCHGGHLGNELAKLGCELPGDAARFLGEQNPALVLGEGIE